MKINLVVLLTILGFTTSKAQDTIVVENTQTIYTIVEKMPVFPGCEDLVSKAEQKTCTDKNLLKWMYQNVHYPSVDFDKRDLSNAFQIVSFVVDTTGAIIEIQTVRGTDEVAKEIKRVITTMKHELQPWTSGEHKGQKVPVRIHLPIRIALSRN